MIIASILRCNALKSYFVPHPPRTPAGIACVRFEWLGGALSRTQIRKPRNAGNSGVWRDSNSPLILFESRGCVALFICLVRKRSARQPHGDFESRCKGFAFGYGLISSVVSQYFSSFAFCFSDRHSISSALLRDCSCCSFFLMQIVVDRCVLRVDFSVP